MIRLALLFSILYSISIYGQLVPGSYAPDFIEKDINGETHHLYELLDQGYYIILDISATWCAPCWSYHNDRELDMLYEKYGPEGSDEFRIFLIEGDASTTIEDLEGTGDDTLGDWTLDTPYPIIDSKAIAELYRVNYFPTIYLICPDRTVIEVGRQTHNQLYSRSNSCPELSDGLNASLSQYIGFEGSFCQDIHFQPEVRVQNLGTDGIRNFTLELFESNQKVQSIDWLGVLNPYSDILVRFDSIFFDKNTNIEFKLSSINGFADDLLASDNSIRKFIKVAPNTKENSLTLEVQTDDRPLTIFWEIINADDQILYFGGNPIVINSDLPLDNVLTEDSTLYNYNIDLPKSGCYTLKVYDTFGDGLFGGYVQLRDAGGNVVVEQGDFIDQVDLPFGVIENDGVVDNMAIISIDNFQEDFCVGDVYDTQIKLVNLGKNPISQFKILVTDAIGEEQLLEWEGHMNSEKTYHLNLDGIKLFESGDYIFSIMEVNGVADAFEYRNEVTVNSTNTKSFNSKWTIDIVTDANAYETYWQLVDPNMNVVAYGGNENVGPDGAGLMVADPSDPGAYANFEHHEIDVDLVEYGCYQLQVVDDAANGWVMSSGFGSPQPIIKITNDTEGVLTITGGRFDESFISNIDFKKLTSVEDNLDEDIEIYPNPSHGFVTIKSGSYDIESLEILDVTGKEIHSQNESVVDLNFLDAGVYFVKLNSKSHSIVKKLILTH